MKNQQAGSPSILSVKLLKESLRLECMFREVVTLSRLSQPPNSIVMISMFICLTEWPGQNVH